MNDLLIWVGFVDGKLFTDTNVGPIHELTATIEQVHSAMARNGWVRITGKQAVVGNYVHSNNWPLGQSDEPLKEYYA